MKILGIETSCDETGIAILSGEPGKIRLLSNLISSQINLHAKTGGIVPEVAARAHVEVIIPLLEEALEQANLELSEIDAIAVTCGPGLLPSLLIGTCTGKTLAFALGKKILGIHHIEAHIYANLLQSNNADPAPEMIFPLLCLVVSGGHTELVLMKKHLHYQILGQTRDDAAGETFDKVARVLNLGFPGGPIVSKRAEQGNASAILLPRPMLKDKNFDFSFSGLKTAVINIVREKRNLDEKFVNNLCASFQEAATDVLVAKTIRAAKKFGVKQILLAGGVAANKNLRAKMQNEIQKELPDVNFHFPELEFCTDNAAMIAVAGYMRALQKDFKSWRKIDAQADLELTA